MTTTIDRMTREASVARMEEIHERLTALSEKHRMSKADEQEFSEAGAEFDALSRHVEKLDRAAAIAGAAGEGSASLRIERAIDPYAGQDAAAERLAGGHRDSAMRQLERAVKGGLPARAAETVERLIETGPDHERSWTSRWVTDTGSEAYRSCFAKLVMFGEARAGLEWTAAERAAYDRVSRLKQEQRALSLTDSAGGFLVPYELDPSVIITSAGSTNPLLQISRVVSTVTDVWHGVSAAAVQASWDAEASEVSDDSPPFAEPSIPNYKGAAFVPFSIELAGDAPTLLTEIGKLLSDGMLQLLNDALTTGSGTGMPTGIITALTGGSSVVAAGTADTLVAADVYNVQSSLGPRWQANARWCANLAILNKLRQLETANGSLVFPELRLAEPTLAGKPIHELSNMDATLSGGAGNDPVLLYGDFSNFVVSQRIGSAVELIPHLFGANRRPTGQRGMYMYARYGSDSVNDAAFRLLVA
jgi:HK97 family phage major capsid protein